MRFLRQSMIGVFLAAVTLGLLLYAGQMVSSALQERLSAEPRVPKSRERVFAVNVQMAKAETVSPEIQVFGEVAARRTLELRAAVSGRIIELADAFEEGGKVQKGAVLVRIDPADMQSEMGRLQADLADAQAEQRDAIRGLALARDEESAAREQAALQEKAFQRQSDLAQRGVGTAAAVEVAELAAAAARAGVLSRRQAVTIAEARIDQAKTRLTRAEIAIAEAERDLADTKLKAPFDGTISETAVVEGGLVAANERLADLIDPSNLEVSFRLSTAQYTRLLDSAGSLIKAPVTATLDAGGVDIAAQGKITRVSAAAGEGQTGRLVFATLTQAPGFRPGDFVSVSVQEPPLDAVVRLPSSALDANAQLLVLVDEDKLEPLTVELMRRQGDDVLVRGVGLEGREVVLARSPLLGPGMTVRPLRSGSQDVVEAPTMLELTDERRAKLVAFVEGNTRMPPDAKTRVLAQLAEPQVPAQVVARIESRMGG